MNFRVCLLALGWGLLASAGSAAVFVVDSTGDEADMDLSDGICRTAVNTCTLRAAIEQANALPGADVVQFAIPGTGVHTISPMSPLPPLTDDAGITIDGYSQPGASPNTLAVGDDAVLLIQIDGAMLALGTGIRVMGANASIRGISLGAFETAAISLEGGFGHFIQGCFLGTDRTGMAARPNSYGIVVSGFSANASSFVATIGGGAPLDRNLISGNSADGVLSGLDSRLIIQGNYIGTDASGTHAVPNVAAGVVLSGSRSTVGGDGPGEGNLISGNGSGIVSFSGTNVFSGNRIGTNASGLNAIPNVSGVELVGELRTAVTNNVIAGNSGVGIRVNGGSEISIGGNSVGLAGAGLGNGSTGILVLGPVSRSFIGGVPNTIAFNGGAGIQVGSSTTDIPVEVAITQNSIHDNGTLGIDLAGDGPTLNNDCDSGRGPNLGQNFPVIDFAGVVPGGTRVSGYLNSVPGLLYRIDFYSSTTCDPTGYGEGETWIGSGAFFTESDCLDVFDVFVNAVVPAGSVITATATDPAGNTSEFSACRPVSVGQDFFTIAPCRVADTRDPDGPYGGPALAVGSDRTFVVAGQCGIPSDAQAVSLNVTVTMPTAAGDVRLFASGTLMPLPPAVNYAAGQTRARDGIFALGIGGGIDVHVDQSAGTVHLILDVTGYFR